MIQLLPSERPSSSSSDEEPDCCFHCVVLLLPPTRINVCACVLIFFIFEIVLTKNKSVFLLLCVVSFRGLLSSIIFLENNKKNKRYALAARSRTMENERCKIEFDNGTGVFHSGQTMRGTISLICAAKGKKIRCKYFFSLINKMAFSLAAACVAPCSF